MDCSVHFSSSYLEENVRTTGWVHFLCTLQSREFGFKANIGCLDASVLLKSMARPTGLVSFRLDDLRFCCSTKNDIVNVVKVARQ